MKKKLMIGLLMGSMIIACCACGSNNADEENALTGEDANESAEEQTGMTVSEIAEISAAEKKGEGQSDEDVAKDAVGSVFEDAGFSSEMANNAVAKLYEVTDFGACKGIAYLKTTGDVNEYTMTDYNDVAYTLRINADDGTLIEIVDADGNVVYAE